MTAAVRGLGGSTACRRSVAGQRTTPSCGAATGTPLPDPRSRWQPDGVHGPAGVYDHDRASRGPTPRWRGVALPGAVFYELHVGHVHRRRARSTRRSAGSTTCVELGVDVVELMPVAAFPGVARLGLRRRRPVRGARAVRRPGRAASGSSTPATRAGSASCSTSSTTTSGPAGNYLPRFGPYFTERHHTPWGAAVNLDDAGRDEVRRWIVDNALHVAARLPRRRAAAGRRARAASTTRAVHLLEELSDEVDALATQLGRPLFLDRRDRPQRPADDRRRARRGGLRHDAQWSDDFHHALHAALTGERQGYYADFGSLGDALARR